MSMAVIKYCVAKKVENEVTFYLDGELFTVVSQQELNAYIEASQI